MTEAEAGDDPLEAIKKSWAKELVKNFRRAEEIIKDSGVRDLLFRIKKESFPSDKFIASNIISNPGPTLQELEEIADSVTKYPYHKPDLRCWLSLEWCGKDGMRCSIIINADPHGEALVIAGKEVKRLEKEEWQKREIIFETLMSAIRKPILSCNRLSKDDSI